MIEFLKSSFPMLIFQDKIDITIVIYINLLIMGVLVYIIRLSRTKNKISIKNYILILRIISIFLILTAILEFLICIINF